MNQYIKWVPNVFLAKCPEPQEKGSTIDMTLKYGGTHEVIVFNLVARHADGSYLYSVVRADGYNAQERAKAKAERRERWAESAKRKSNEYYEASNKDRAFLSLGEPIKVGHHSEARHRKIIDQAWNNMGKSVAMDEKADAHLSNAAYWEARAEQINLSMPESLEYYEAKVEEMEELHQGLKDGSIPRDHSMSLQYSSKNLKETKKKLELAKVMWGE